MTEFKVRIELGNAAMQSDKDLAGALRDIANRLEVHGGEGRVRDYNGNTVGEYGIDWSTSQAGAEEVAEDG